MLRRGGSVAYLALAANADGVFEGMTRLTFVETDLRAGLHFGVEEQADDEARALGAPHFA